MSPIEDWVSFGFDDKYEHGFDYSWIFIQDGAYLISSSGVVRNVKIYFSSRKKYVFMIVLSDNTTYIWDVKPLSFSFYSPCLLEVIMDQNIAHIEYSSLNFIRILIKFGKILPENGEKACVVEQMEILKQTTKPLEEAKGMVLEPSEVPKKSDLEVYHAMLTGNSTNPIIGNVKFTKISFYIDSKEPKIFEYTSITSLEKVYIRNSFIVFYTQPDSRYEISLTEPSETRLNNLYKRIRAAIDKATG